MEETEGWPLGIVLAAAGARRSARALAGAARRLLRGGGARRPDPERRAPGARGGDGAGPRPRRRPRASAPGGRRGAAFPRAPGGLRGRRPSIRSSASSCAGASRRRCPPSERRAVAARLADALEAAGRGRMPWSSGSPARTGTRAADAVAREGGALVRRAPETVEGWLAALPADRRAAAGAHAARRPARARPRPAGRGGGALPRRRRGLRRQRGAAVPALRRPLRAGRRLPRRRRPARRRGARRGARRARRRRRPVGARRSARSPPSRSRSRAASRRAGRCATARSPTRWPRRSAGSRRSSTGYYLELPAGQPRRRAAARRPGDRCVRARWTPSGACPYVLLFKFAIHEERGEDEDALALAARGREIARQTGLAGWVGAGTSIRIASLKARLGDVPPPRRSWPTSVRMARVGHLGVRGHARGHRRRARRGAGGACRPRSAPRAQLGDRVPWFDRMRCTALLAPTLVRAGQPARARALVEETLAASPPGFSGARLTDGARVAPARGGRRDGLGRGAGRRVGGGGRPGPPRGAPRVAAGGAAAVGGAGAWGRGPERPSAPWPTRAPGGSALGPFTRHPVAAVRRRRCCPRWPPGIPRRSSGWPTSSAIRTAGVAAAAAAAAERLRRDPRALAFRLFGAVRAAPGRLGRAARRSGSAAWPRGSSACCSAAPASR